MTSPQHAGMSETGRTLFREAAQALGLDISPTLEAFSVFQAMLIETGSTTNLTSLLSERDIVLKHFVDSLSCLRSGQFSGSLRVLDLGTGAGFPGLPLAIYQPQLDITLLDSTRKKIDFVGTVIAAIGLGNAAGLVGRAEWLARQGGGRAQYDRVVTRAVSSLPALIELSLPLLKVGGVLVAQKGPITEAELKSGRLAAAEVGGVLDSAEPLVLPVLGDLRTLVCIRKTRPTSERYPRREGVPAKHPLF